MCTQKSPIERLKSAVINGDATATKRLLKGGVNVNATFWYESNLLHEAIACGHPHIVRLLIDAKADVNSRNEDGRMPLHIACRNGNEEIVSMLLKAKARINVQTKDGKTCLNTALWRGHANVANMLIYKGADVNLADQDGWTALHWASKANLVPCVETLIAVGANLNALDKFGRSPLHEALATGNPRLLTLLLLHGADPNIQPKIRNTSTMMLLLNRKDHNPELINLLIHGGYSIHLDVPLHRHLLIPSSSFPTNDCSSLQLLKALYQVPSLLHLCRLVIRRHVNRCHSGRSIMRKIELLPLPDRTRHYLAFKDELPAL